MTKNSSNLPARRRLRIVLGSSLAALAIASTGFATQALADQGATVAKPCGGQVACQDSGSLGRTWRDSERPTFVDPERPSFVDPERPTFVDPDRPTFGGTSTYSR